MNLSDVMPAVAFALNAESVTDLEFWSETELLEFAGDEIRRMRRELGPWVQVLDEIEVQTGGAAVAYPATHAATVLVALDGVSLHAATVEELEAGDDAWEMRSGTPTHYTDEYLSPLVWRMYPIPDANGAAAMVYRNEPVLTEDVPMPAPVGDLVTLAVIRDARAKDSPGAMPDGSAVAAQVLTVFAEALTGYWS